MEEINFVQMYPSLNSHPLGVTLGILIYQPYQEYPSVALLFYLNFILNYKIQDLVGFKNFNLQIQK